MTLRLSDGTVLIRKIRKGMMGLVSRDSSTTKATSRTTAAPTKPRVWAEAQWYSVAVEMP